MNETEIYNIFAHLIQDLPKFDLVRIAVAKWYQSVGKYPNIVQLRAKDPKDMISVVLVSENRIERKLIEIIKQHAAWEGARNRENFWSTEEYAVASEVGHAYRLFANLARMVINAERKVEEAIRDFLESPERLRYVIALNLYTDCLLYEPIDFSDQIADTLARRLERILVWDKERDEERTEVSTSRLSYSLRLAAAVYQLYRKNLISVGFKVEARQPMLKILPRAEGTVRSAIVPVGFMSLTNKARRLVEYVASKTRKSELRRQVLHAIDEGDIDSALVLAALDR